REENIQTVPVAITAYSAEEIAKRDIRSVTELAYNVPAFNNRVTQRRTQVQSQTMRALPGVQFYFAEVPTSLGGEGNFLDLANVQALVGPQGTLFGLNATGGAILREPKRPTNKFEGWI